MDNRKIIPISSTTATLRGLQQKYPTRPNRYLSIGWNAASQDCYTSNDLTLLSNIQKEYQLLNPDPDVKPHFSTLQEASLWGLWKCDRPKLDGKLISFNEKSFTLPNRESKDVKSFPLWEFADRTARQIANWQAERAVKSSPELINDPTMLVLEELRDWFFHTLSVKQGKPEDLQYITQRQSYINKLVHMLPNFGNDRLHLLDISNKLDEAYNTVLGAIANRELPQLLSSTIIDTKSLENTIGTYLHHLIVNEEVDDNFSMACLDPASNACTASPVQKIYKAARSVAPSTQQTQPLVRYQEKTSLYALNPIKENDQIAKPELRIDAANAVKFASFVTEADKKNYVEALALLETLTNVRKTLEHSQSLQSKIGTYSFAYSYLEEANELAKHYNSLVLKATNLLGRLLNTADDGLRVILSDNTNHQKTVNTQFEKNLRALQTKVVINTTLKNQLDAFSRKAIGSMTVYNGKMAELVADLKSGKASDEIKREMRDLYVQLSDLNIWLDAMLNDEQLKVDINQREQCLDAPFSAKCAEKELLADGDSKYEPIAKVEQTQIVQEPAPVPDRLEVAIATAARSAGYGAMRGATNVMGNAMQSRGYSQQVASLTSQIAYYGMYFASRFYLNYDAQNQDPNKATLDAVQNAAIETGQMWVTSTVLNQVGQYLESAGETLARNNWTYTGAGVKKLGALAHYGLFAVGAVASDPVNAAVGFAAGAAAETLTERVGDLVFNR